MSLIQTLRQAKERFRHKRSPYICNICGQATQFDCPDPALARESLVCVHCRTTSRYRSLAKGLLRAIHELKGVDASSLADLPNRVPGTPLQVYDTQIPFAFEACGYPLPKIIGRQNWIEVSLSRYRPDLPWGSPLERNTFNENLEHLTFPDESFDIVLTTDVMEHVRLDHAAHREIARVLKPGGIYLFTVPHFRHQYEHLIRVRIIDPENPEKDKFLLEPEYHGDANSPEGSGVLSYRVYGAALDDDLKKLGLEVLYSKEDDPMVGIMNTELFYCRKRR